MFSLSPPDAASKQYLIYTQFVIPVYMLGEKNSSLKK